jgi:hypothetical protein
MRPDEAYDLANRIKALGLAYFPKVPQTLIETGTALQPLRTTQGDELVQELSQWSQWDVGKFTRCVAAFKAAAKAQPKEETRRPPVSTPEQVEAAQHYADTLPEEHPVYQAVKLRWIRRITQMFGEGHTAAAPPLLDRNVRLQLLVLTLAGKLPTIHSESTRTVPEADTQRHAERTIHAGRPGGDDPRR